MFVTGRLTTHITAIRTLPSMYSLMYLQMHRLSECFITHLTAIRTLPSMYSLMYRQMHWLSECFITFHVSNRMSLIFLLILRDTPSGNTPFPPGEQNGGVVRLRISLSLEEASHVVNIC